MEKNKENKMTSQINVSLNILPFGSLNLQISEAESPEVESETEKPRYVQPLITNVERVNIYFLEHGETYSAPKTTGG